MHEVEKMVFAGATPWHGLGTQIDENVGFWDAFKLAGLDWEVACEPLQLVGGQQIDKARAVVRQTDKRVLGVVGPQWSPLQNKDAFKVFEPMIDKGDLVLHTAGSLREGERVWVLGQLNIDNQQIVQNDEIASFVLLSNGHDGKIAVHFGFTPIRVVCANTEALARRSQISKLIRVRHHSGVKEKVEKLRDIMDLAKREFAATADEYRFLASVGINRSDLAKYVKTVFDINHLNDSDISTRQKNIVKRVETLFEIGKGNNLPGVSGTYWAAYNAMTEYLNYEKGNSAANRMDSLWFGQNAAISTRALKVATEMATAA